MCFPDPMYEPRNILLTGGCGFIGSHVADLLLAKYPAYKVVVLDRLDYCSSPKNLSTCRQHPNFKFFRGDVSNSDFVAFILASEHIDTVLHFAASTHVDNSFGNSLDFTKNNVYGTHMLLEAARTAPHPIRRFVYVSTDEVYGEKAIDALECDRDSELSRLSPTNPYAATKAAAEMVCYAYMKSYGLPILITRGNNAYGPRQFPEKLVPKFLMLAMEGHPLPVHGTGENRRSYLHISDVAEAFNVILHAGEVGAIYNISAGVERTVRMVALEVCAMFKLDPVTHIVHTTDRLFNDQRYHIESSKLQRLGWMPRVSWEEGLAKTAAWYREHRGHWGNVDAALVAHPPAQIMLQPMSAQEEIEELEHEADGGLEHWSQNGRAIN